MEFSNVGALSVGIIELSQVDSTNSYLKREAARLFACQPQCDIFVAVADEQSAGRGQRGAVWNSAKGENLLMSLVVRPSNLPVSEYYLLSVVTALALKSAMNRIGIETIIKWPNDVYANGGKLAGVLLETDIESSYVSQAIIGVGLNVNQRHFPSMSRNPVSMALIAETNFNRDVVLRILLDEFSHYYTMLLSSKKKPLFSMYKQSLMGADTPMLYRDANGEFQAVVHDVHSDGHIILKRNDGTLSSYAFKEVETVIWGY